jgi:hypothetical protein
MRKLEITNKRILAFYEANPNINFESVNLIFLDIFDKLLLDKDKTIQSSLQTQIMNGITEHAANMNDIKQTINTLKDTMFSINQENHLLLFSKLVECRKEYIEDLHRMFLSQNVETIGPLLEKNNAALIDKTSLLIHDILPSSHLSTQELLRQFHQSISADTAQLMKSVDAQSTKEFLNHFEIKSSLMLQNLQQPIYSYISASEERILTNMNTLKEGSGQQKLLSNLDKFLHKFPASICGTASTTNNQSFCNNHLSGVLTKMYNSAEISTQNMAASAHSGSILLKRLRKTNILIENKDSSENITVDDIHSFLLLIEEYNCNGIFISQSSGICTKKNYQIELYNNNIVVFLHNVEYSSAKIESAVDIIDNLSGKLRQCKGQTNDDCIIPKDLLDSINTEFQLFLTQKNAVIDVFKESQKKVLSQIDELRFPCLDKFLSTKYSAPVQKPGLKCDLCKCFTANNLKALAAHKRGCIRKNTLVNASNTLINVSTT